MTRETSPRKASALSAYRRHAMRHFSQAIVIVFPMALAIRTDRVLAPLLLLLAAEALLLAVLPLFPSFQRQVRESVAREARARLIAERAQLTPEMAAEHRVEVEALEPLVEKSGRARDAVSNVRTGSA